MVILSFHPPQKNKKNQRKNEGKSLKCISYNIIISGLIKKKKVESKDKSSVISGAFPLEAIMLGKHIVTYIDKKCMINHPKTKGIVLYF